MTCMIRGGAEGVSGTKTTNTDITPLAQLHTELGLFPISNGYFKFNNLLTNSGVPRKLFKTDVFDACTNKFQCEILKITSGVQKKF